MNQDILKFQELMLTDTDIQQKLRETAQQYTGDPADEKAVFESILLPVANSVGLSATYEEFQAYAEHLSASDTELSEDELAQVAGGKGGGLVIQECALIGLGLGAGGAWTEDRYAAGLCAVIGAGMGDVTCFFSGELS